MSTSFKASPDVIIRTDRFDAASSFYEHVLALPVVHRTAGLVAFDAGAFKLYVERGPDHGPVFDFHVGDFDAARAALLANGCMLLEEDRAVPRCYLQDPFGVVFNIEQRAPRLA